MKTSLELGFRAAFSKAGRGRFVAFTVVGLITCACLLTVVTTPQVKAREYDRFQAALRVSGKPDAETPDPGMYDILTSYRGRTMLMVLVPDDLDRSRLPPGVDAVPPPGEVRFSPALAARVADDPLLAQWFPYERGADLPVTAVSSAGEYKAYIGVVGPTAPYTRGARGSGVQATKPFGYFQWLGLLLFVGAPALGLVAISGRFGRRIRRERLAALRLLGMSPLACRTALAIETGLPVALGAVFSVVGAALLRPDHVVLPVVGRWVFGDDAALGSTSLGGVLAVTCLLGAWIGAATPHQHATGRLTAVVARADVTRSWTVAMYVLGMVLVVSSWVRVEPKDPQRFVGIVLVACGLPGAVAIGAKVLARLLCWNAGPVPWFLAMRKLASDPRSLSRVAGLVGVVVFVVGVSQPIAQLVAAPSDTWVGVARADRQTTVLGWSESAQEAQVPLALDGPPPAGTRVAVTAIQLWHPGGAPATRALIGSCNELEMLFGHALPTCNARVQRLIDPSLPSSAPVAELESRGTDGGRTARIPPTDSDLMMPSQDLPLPGLVIPPELAPESARSFVTGVYVRVDTNSDAWVAAQGWIMRGGPVFRAFNVYEGRTSSDTTGSWIIFGLGIAAAIASLGTVLTGLDEQRSTNEWASLRALGMGSAQLVLSRLTISAVTAVTAVAAATIPSLIVTAGFLKLESEQLDSFGPFVVAAAAGGAAILITNGVTAALQMRRLNRPAP